MCGVFSGVNENLQAHAYCEARVRVFKPKKIRTLLALCFVEIGIVESDPRQHFKLLGGRSAKVQCTFGHFLEFNFSFPLHSLALNLKARS